MAWTGTAGGTALTTGVEVGTTLDIPVNHFEGNYTCEPDTLAELRAEDRVVFRYVDNPNGSVDDIAGICNEGRNVVGLMPHPERAVHAILGSTDGVPLLQNGAQGLVQLTHAANPTLAGVVIACADLPQARLPTRYVLLRYTGDGLRQMAGPQDCR